MNKKFSKFTVKMDQTVSFYTKSPMLYALNINAHVEKGKKFFERKPLIWKQTDRRIAVKVAWLNLMHFDFSFIFFLFVSITINGYPWGLILEMKEKICYFYVCHKENWIKILNISTAWVYIIDRLNF